MFRVATRDRHPVTSKKYEYEPLRVASSLFFMAERNLTTQFSSEKLKLQQQQQKLNSKSK